MRRFLSVAVLASVQTAFQESPTQLEDIRAYLPISGQLATAGQIRYEQIPALKEKGFEVVVNLAPAHQERNAEEGFRITELGLTYVHIPVDWQSPLQRDLKLFFDVMEANQDRKVFVHCFANMRVSVFVYLYRTLVKGEQEEAALDDLHRIWDPNSQEQWKRFIQEAKNSHR